MGQGWFWEVYEPSAPHRRPSGRLPRPMWTGRHWLTGEAQARADESAAVIGLGRQCGTALVSSSGVFISFLGDISGTRPGEPGNCRALWGGRCLSP